MTAGERRETGTDGGRPTSSERAVPVRSSDVEGEGDIRVLHVDDEPALLDVTEEYLSNEDERITVETATSAREGLGLLEERFFDVVVSDYQMAGMDGLDFLREVRERGWDLPFIVFTGRGREEVAVDALNLGADRYLQKGGDPRSQYGLLADAIVQETAHQRARDTLHESEERYRTLVEAIPDIVFITDYESRMRWANDALERQTGLTVEDFQMSQEENPFIHPDDAERVAEHIGAFVESDRTYSEPVDNRFIDANGDVHWYSSVIAKTTYDGDPALQFITRDISERKRREQRLQRIERRYRRLVESFPRAVVALFDEDLRYVDVGGAAMDRLAADPGDVEALSVERVDAEPFAAVDADDCRAVLGGESRRLDHEGEGETWDLHLLPVEHRGESAAGFVIAFPD